MTFRADEDAESNRARAVRYLTGQLPHQLRGAAESKVHQIIDQHGPVIDSYPIWHPFLAQETDMATRPDSARYGDLDHTIFLCNGMITCPYESGDKITKAVHDIGFTGTGLPCGDLCAEKLDVKLYSTEATAVLIWFDWSRFPALTGSERISQRAAVGLATEAIIKDWSDAQVGETWESMAPYLLGCPHGSRSSLFVNEATGSAIKKIFKAISDAGAFGPIHGGKA